MTPPVTKYELVEGDCYTYNFPACPPAKPSVYLGNVQVGSTEYLAFQTVEGHDLDGFAQEGEVRFLNPLRLSSIRPDSW